MKKRKVRFLAALLLVILAVGLCGDFHSYENQSKTIPCEENGLIFSITTFDGDGESRPFVKCLGHSWVAVENRTGHSVMLKDYELQDGELLSFSVWAVSGHRGIFFNLEPEFIRSLGRYAGRQTLRMNIGEAQLKTIEEYIDAHDRWEAGKNCSYWSVHLWNALAPREYLLKTQTLLYTPKRLEKSFREFDCVETDKDFSGAQEIFFYQDGVRTEAELCL